MTLSYLHIYYFLVCPKFLFLNGSNCSPISTQNCVDNFGRVLLVGTAATAAVTVSNPTKIVYTILCSNRTSEEDAANAIPNLQMGSQNIWKLAYTLKTRLPKQYPLKKGKKEPIQV